jgi:hypothetical protein
MIHLISLNELVLPKFLVFTLLRRNVKILGVASIVPRADKFLQRMADRAVAAGRATYAVDLAPELSHHWEYDRRLYFQDLFKKYEPWQNRYYRFERPELANDPIYGYGFKQMTCSYTFRKMIQIYLLDALSRKLDPKDYRVHGVLADTIALGRDRFGEDFATGVSQVSYPRAMLNFFLALAALFFTVGWLVQRLRFFVKVEKVDVAFDRLDHPCQFHILKELSPAGRFLIVDRLGYKTKLSVPEDLKYMSCSRTDGLFSPLAWGRAIVEVVFDITRLTLRHWRTPPGLLHEMLTLPYKRVLVRGLMIRYRPEVFIGRDEYNVDHIMRRAELRPLGVKSIGISNGIYPAWAYVSPNVRYVSFDTYFSFAALLYDQYLETWATDMRILTIGSYSISREQQLLQHAHHGEAILFTIRIAWNRPETTRMIRAVAKAFPKRKVLLQFKEETVNAADADRIVKECGDGLDNFEHTTEDVYTLLPKAKFHISDISTVVAEAIYSGVTTLVADLLDQEFNCYRLFPGLTIKTADGMVNELKALECGEKIYPRQKYFELLGYKQSEVGFDRLREEIGVEPSQAFV